MVNPLPILLPGGGRGRAVSSDGVDDVALKLSYLLAELKRRKVTRVALVYILVGLGVIEAVDIIGDRLLFPQWAIQFVIVLVLLGLPIALVLAWALEVTPEGIRRTLDLPPEELAAHGPDRWRASNWVMAGMGLVLICAGVYYVFFRGEEAPRIAEVAALPQDRVVVFPFDNLSGDPAFDDLGEATAHWVTDGLSRTEEVRAVPTSAVVQAVAAYGEGAAPADIATSLQAGLMVTGVVTRRGEELELQAQLADVATQEILESVQGSGPASNPMAAADDLRGRVMSALALRLGKLNWSTLVHAPPTYEALKAYQRGQRVFVTQGSAASIPFLEEAYRLDTTFATPINFLGAAYGNLELWAEADSVLAIITPHRHELSRWEALYLEYLLARNAGENQARLNAARALSEVDPYTAGYTHGNAAMAEGRPREALAALTGADPDDPLWREWTAYWTRLFQAHFALGQYEEALEVARKRRERFPSSLIARQHEVAALIALGRLDEVEPILDEVETIEPTPNNSPGSVFRYVAVSFLRFSHPDRGRELAERSVAWYTAAHPERYQADRAFSLYLVERPDEALPLQRALVEEDPESITPRGRLGVLLAVSGDTAGAEAQEQWLAGLDRPYLHGESSYWRAAILAHLDRRDEAVRVLRQALSEGRSYGERAMDPWLMPLWDHGPFEQLVAPRG